MAHADLNGQQAESFCAAAVAQKYQRYLCMMDIPFRLRQQHSALQVLPHVEGGPQEAAADDSWEAMTHAGSIPQQLVYGQHSLGCSSTTAGSEDHRFPVQGIYQVQQ